ncbi:MAG: GH3 auxin-responsive promoter [Bacteroidetes bacterium]|nr:MAG: GH3 auxin-responsive promoter [Bacteroidota bacterium]
MDNKIKRSSLLQQGARLQKVLDRRRSPIASQERVLRHLLKRAENTAFGQHYQFEAILDAEDMVAAFQERIPVFDYDTLFSEWWHRTLDGEEDVCWPGKNLYFALSSGTSGATSKYIPITSDMTRSMRSAALRMFSCLPKYQLPASLYTKGWLMVGGSASLNRLKTGAYAGDLSGINAKRPPLWIRRYFKPGTEVAQLKTWDERIKVISERAPSWDVSIITGIPSWVQLTLERIIADHKLNNIHEIWPNLRVFVTGGIAFEPYRKSFEKLLARPLIYQDSYLASEGFIAFQSRPGTHAMRLVTNNGIFFEFIPFDDDHFNEHGLPRPNAVACTLEDVELQRDYALVISTNAGAWRYLIGDTIRFTDLERNEIIITGRTKHFLSMCGEHLSVDNMNHAVQEVEEKLGIAFPEYSVGGVKVGSHFAHHWYLACNDPDVDATLLSQELDAALRNYNDDYGAERGAMLQPPLVTIVPGSAFYDWQRSLGKLNGQSKIPRVMKGEQLQQWQDFVAKSF